MLDDAELLRQYAEDGSEGAFAAFVRRHLPLVYSVALRRVGGDAYLAQDVAQRVFTDLARKAAPLSRRRTLTGWLFTSARFAAAEAVRGERRRRRHEQESLTMHDVETNPAPEADWDRLRPALDDLVNGLGETDRQAVLLRFFEGCPFADIGAKLCLSENTARMRVERTLEKLRSRLDRRGVKSTAAALGVVLANQTGVAMPVGLATTVTGSALAGAAAAGTSSFLQFFTMNKLTLGLLGIVAGTGIAVSVAEIRASLALRAEIAGLSQQARDLGRLSAENGRLRGLQADFTAEGRSKADLLQVKPGATAGGTPSAEGSMQAAVARRLDTIPAPIDQARPIYPYDLRHAGVSGRVIVDFVVDNQGNVLNAFASSSTQAEFEGPAVQAVSQWVFRPGEKNGHGVFTHMQVPIVFGSDSSAEIAPDPAPPESAVSLSAFYVKG